MPWNELKMLRESAGLSQEALAKKISISQSALGNYERQRDRGKASEFL